MKSCVERAARHKIDVDKKIGELRGGRQGHTDKCILKEKKREKRERERFKHAYIKI